MKNKVAPFISSSSSIHKIINCYYISIALLIVFNIYKNGIFVIINNGAIVNLIKSIFLPLIGFACGVATEFIYNYKKKDKNISFKQILNGSFLPVFGLLMSLTMSININVILFTVICLGLLFLYKTILNNKTINIIALSRILTSIVMFLFGGIAYSNSIESTKRFSYNFLDLITGKSITSLGASNILLIVLIFLALTFMICYKYRVALYIICSYVVTIFLFRFLGVNVTILSNLLSSELFFVSVLIGNMYMFSSYTKIGKVFFGFLVGIFGAILTTFVSNTEGLYLSVLIISFLSPYLDLIKFPNPKR